MLIACVPVALMATGLVVCIRGFHLADGTREGTIARFEAERAAEAGGLLTLLSLPWVALTQIFVI